MQDPRCKKTLFFFYEYSGNFVAAFIVYVTDFTSRKLKLRSHVFFSTVHESILIYRRFHDLSYIRVKITINKY